MRLIDADAIINTLGCSDRDIYVKACIEEDATTVPAVPLDRIKEAREEIEQLRLIGYATVDGKREIASRAVLQVLDKLIAEVEGKDATERK